MKFPGYLKCGWLTENWDFVFLLWNLKRTVSSKSGLPLGLSMEPTRPFAGDCLMCLLFSEKSREAFETWKKHDDAQDNFCELDGEYS